MKRTLALFLCICLIAGLTACGNPAETADEPEPVTEVVSEPEVEVEEVDTRDYVAEFKDKMKDSAYDCYDITHNYDAEDFLGVGYGENEAKDSTIYCFAMRTEDKAKEKAEGLLENFDNAEYKDESGIEYGTAMTDGVKFLVGHSGKQVVLIQAPGDTEAKDIVDLMTLILAE